MTTRESQPAAGDHADAPVARTVLYIEDNPTNVKLLESIFSRVPEVALLIAREPLGGLALARSARPAVIILDINLPLMDGYEVFERLRADELTRDIPVLALSANAMPADVERGREAGFVDYVTKPIQVVPFRDRVLELLRTSARPPASH